MSRDLTIRSDRDAGRAGDGRARRTGRKAGDPVAEKTSRPAEDRRARRRRRWRAGAGILALASTVALAGCGGPPDVPPPRPLILHSGARLNPEHERLREIDVWIRPQLENIREDPSFLIRTVPRDTTVYPWSGLEIQADTANVAMRRGLPEARVPYMVYAHLHLMEERGELEQWLPEVAEAEEFDQEVAILRRTADAWLYGRSAWDAPPYEALDEITYAHENGYLEPLIFTARPDRFAEARRAWVAENPGGIEEYRGWFVDTFGREPPGLREEAASQRGLR